MKYLLDTTWVVGYLRKKNEQLTRRVGTLRKDGLAVSVISVAELYEGIHRSEQPEKNERALQEFLRLVTVLEVTPDVARMYGQMRAELIKKGTVIGALDVLIAATARTNGLTLLTFDRDFERIRDLSVQFS